MKMKIEEYPCVKIKREAQARDYEITKGMECGERLARLGRSFEALVKRREELRGAKTGAPAKKGP